MTHNDVLRSIRYLLNVSDAALVDVFRLGHREVSRDRPNPSSFQSPTTPC
jgi:uncharacterized protein YehS (DUF1456 family)